MNRHDLFKLEAIAWLKACLNMVDGNGLPPNWDELRKFIKQWEREK